MVTTLHTNIHTVKSTVMKGCPYSSCCGPGFWNIMYNAPLDLDFSSHMKVIAFADDQTIMTNGNTPPEAGVFANSGLAKIEKWAKENKMQFIEIKSKAMLITIKRNNENINIYLNNRRLEVVKEMKYSGIYFDSQLTFDNHIKYTAENSTKLIYMLAKSAKLQWDLGHKSLKTIYEGAMIPLLTYEASVWEEAVLNKRNLCKLQRVQRLINIKIVKVYRTISFEASCMMSGIPPIGIETEEKARLYKIKHNVERSEYECDIALPVKEWPHPARCLNIMEIRDSTLYSNRDLHRWKQNQRQSRSRSGHICGPSIEKAVQIQATKLLFKQ